MITVRLEKLQLNFPDGFTLMGDEERKELKIAQEGDQNICLKDEKRHIVVSTAYQKLNGFAALILNSASIAGRMEKQVADLMKKMAYRPMGKKTRTFAYGKADGFAYAYTVEEIPMYGESYVMKDGKDCYYLHFYVREENRSECEKLINGVFSLVVLEL